MEKQYALPSGLWNQTNVVSTPDLPFNSDADFDRFLNLSLGFLICRIKIPKVSNLQEVKEQGPDPTAPEGQSWDVNLGLSDSQMGLFSQTALWLHPVLVGAAGSPP